MLSYFAFLRIHSQQFGRDAQDFIHSATCLKQKIDAALVPSRKLLNMVSNDRMFVPMKHKLLTIQN